MHRFSDNHTFDARQRESRKIILKYPTRIPIIVEKCTKCTLNDIDKRKYLVPKDMLMGQFTHVIRKRINLNESQALFVMVDNQLTSGNTQIGDLYEQRSNEDGFLYITYASENTFG